MTSSTSHARRAPAGKALPGALVGTLALAGACWLAPAQAAKLAGPDGEPDKASRPTAPSTPSSPSSPSIQATPAGRATASAATTPAPGLTLAGGVIGAVDLRALRATINGQSVPLHPERLRVLSPQGQSLGGAAALRGGMVVRFALEPALAPGAERRVVLVQVERQP